MKCAQTFEIGVYVLGALAPAERDAFERHLGECASCREEVAELAVLPGLLGRLDLATATAVARDGEQYGLTEDGADEGQRWAGPTAVPDRSSAKGRWAGPTAEAPEEDEARPEPAGGNVVPLLDAARRRRAAERRRRRGWSVVAGVAAACLAVVVGFGAPRLFGDEQSNRPSLTAMTAVASNIPIAAEVGLAKEAGGSRVTMHCVYRGNSGERWAFNLVVVPRSGGAPEEVANWTAGYGDDIQVSATTHYAPNEIARLDLRRNDGTPVLVRTL
jgi:anti-sigma factor RsiW